MDHHSIHGRDVSSFDLPSTHRLPTVSAAQAYVDLTSDPTRFVSTGLEALDTSLAAAIDGLEPGLGGVQRGLVTEVWGPPGVGKTTFGLQLASYALRDGHPVVWVDGFHNICPKRLTAIADGRGASEALSGLTHFACPTLTHLVALLCRPNAACIPSGTSLVVIDSLSALVNHAFPRTTDPKSGPGTNKGAKGPSVSARRQQTLQYIIGALQKLAASRNLAVVILTQCATKMQVERGASLVPAVNAAFWEEKISSRVVLFRDWSLQGGNATAVYFAVVLKLNGTRVDDGDLQFAAFNICSTGLVAVTPDPHQQQHQPVAAASAAASKRKLGETDFEIPDSDDEDYGWQLDDEDALPSMPPQWQGSEDILLGQDPGRDEHDVSEDEADPEVQAEAPTRAEVPASNEDGSDSIENASPGSARSP